MTQRTRLANAVFLSLLMVCAGVPYAFLNSTALADPQAADRKADLEAALDSAQRPLRVAAFGDTYSDQYIRLSLTAPPLELGVVVGLGPSGEAVTWATAYLGPEMFSQPNQLSIEQVRELDSIRAQAHLAVGTLSGPNGSVSMVALYLASTDQDGTRYNHLVPIGEASANLVERLTEMTSVLQSAALVVVGNDPCASLTHCHDLYRQRISAALKNFVDCMAANAPPFNWCHVACFILCIPFGVGGPLYLACVVPCLLGCTVPGLIDWQTCEATLEWAQQNAEGSYCACIAWKQANCSSEDWETDIVGCGP